MSRIQDILAKAERDGTARRAPLLAPTAPPPASHALANAPGVNGTSALDAMEYVQASMAGPMAEADDLVETLTAPVDARMPLAEPRVAAPEPRLAVSPEPRLAAPPEPHLAVSPEPRLQTAPSRPDAVVDGRSLR